MTTPSVIFISRPPNSFFVTTGTFESGRNIWFRRPHPLSLPTTTVEHTAQTPAWLEQAFGGSCHPRRVYAGGTNWWVVRRRANGGVNAPSLLETSAVA
jgi:hypothetical protein